MLLGSQLSLWPHGLLSQRLRSRRITQLRAVAVLSLAVIAVGALLAIWFCALPAWCLRVGLRGTHADQSDARHTTPDLLRQCSGMSPERTLRQPHPRLNMQPVRLSYDEEGNVAYLRLGEETLRPIKTVPVPNIDPWTVNLDFDAAGRLLGIEVLDAREVLPAELLARFANRDANPS